MRAASAFAWTLCLIVGTAFAAADDSKEDTRMTVDNIHWHGHDAFRIEDAGKQIYIDPWQLPEGVPAADLVLVTHGHYDHFSAVDIARISKPGTVVVAPADVVKQLKGKGTVAQAGKTLEVAGLKVEVVPAYNLNKKFHPKDSGGVGYVLALSTGQRVYHAGDTDAIPEMESLKVDVALLPVSGTYVMTAQEAAAAANKFTPKVVIPMHWGSIVGGKSDAERFKKLFTGETVIKSVEK